ALRGGRRPALRDAGRGALGRRRMESPPALRRVSRGVPSQRRLPVLRAADYHGASFQETPMMLLAMATLLALRGGEPAVELVTKEIEYRHGDVVCEGYVAYPKDAKGKLPGVLICHQWMVHAAYERMRAEETAKLGAVAFALDIYGKGVRPKDAPEAAKLATGYKGDRALLRGRALAGLEA